MDEIMEKAQIHTLEQPIGQFILPLDRSLNAFELSDGRKIYIKFARMDSEGVPVIILWEDGMDLEGRGIQFTCKDASTPLRLTNILEPNHPYVEFGIASRTANDSVRLDIYSNPIQAEAITDAA